MDRLQREWSPMSRVSALAVVAAQAVGQLALVAVLPVLTRSFTPDQLGPYQLALAVALVAQPLVTLRLEVYIPASKSSHSTAYLYRLAMTWASAIAIALLGAGAVLFAIGSREIGAMLAMSALLSFAYGGSAVDSAVLIRNSQRSRLAIRNLVAGVVGAVLQVLVALLIPVPILLALCVTLGRATAVVLTRVRLKRRQGDPGLVGRQLPSWGRIVMLICSGMAWNVSFQSFTLVSGALIGTGPAAIAGTAQRIAGAPLSFVGQAVNQLVQEATGREVREPTGQLSRILRRQLLLLGGAGLLVAVVVSALAPLLAKPVLGSAWGEVGTITAILIWPLALQLAVGPATVVLPMLGLEQRLFSIQIVRAVLIISATLAAGALGGGLLGTTIAFSVATVCSYVILLLALVYSANRADTDYREGSHE